MDPHLETIRSAVKELREAGRSLQVAFDTWSEAVTTMHMAEISLREAQKRVLRGSSLLTTALNGFEGPKTDA